MIKKEVIDSVYNAIEIVDVVSDFVQLRRAGQSFKGLSPFTNEKTPSFVVSPAKGIFKCFSSGKGGDAVTFVMEVEGLSYIETIRYLAGKYGIAIEEEAKKTPEEVQKQSERESLFIALNFAKEHYTKNLLEESQGQMIGLSYFRERGFSNETIKDFGLGYSMDAWDDLKNAALKQQYNLDFFEKAGLIIVKDGGKVFDRFRGRVTFPIHNLTGKVIAFGARILTNDKKQPKYLNSPETDVYHKSKVLYGLYQSKSSIRLEDNCFLVEGYTDVISLHQAGIKNVVASSGTALTVEQIRLIGRYTQNITVLYDGDKAGIRASMRGIDLILQEGLNVNAVMFPEGEDPDSYVRKIGGEAFTRYITDNQKDFLRVKTELFLAEAQDDPILRAEVSKQILESIAKIPDGIKRTIFLQQSSDLLGIEYNVLVQEYERIFYRNKNQADRQLSLQQRKETNAVSSVPAVNQIDTDLKMLLNQEQEITRLLLNYGDFEIGEGAYFAMYLLNELEDLEFKDNICKQIFNVYRDAYGEGHLLEAQELLKTDDAKLKRFIADALTNKHEISKQWEEKHEIYVKDEVDALADVTYKIVLRLKWRNVRYMLKELQQKLVTIHDENEIMDLQNHFAALKQSEMEIGKLLGNVISGR